MPREPRKGFIERHAAWLKSWKVYKTFFFFFFEMKQDVLTKQGPWHWPGHTLFHLEAAEAIRKQKDNGERLNSSIQIVWESFWIQTEWATPQRRLGLWALPVRTVWQATEINSDFSKEKNLLGGSDEACKSEGKTDLPASENTGIRTSRRT